MAAIEFWSEEAGHRGCKDWSRELRNDQIRPHECVALGFDPDIPSAFLS